MALLDSMTTYATNESSQAIFESVYTVKPSFDGIPPPESSEVIILLFSISGWTLMMLDQAALSNTWCVLAAIREPNVKKHSPVLR